MPKEISEYELILLLLCMLSIIVRLAAPVYVAVAFSKR